MAAPFLLLLLPTVLAQNSGNLFKDPGLETLDEWRCNACHGTLSTDSHSGTYSFNVTGRTQIWSGIAQEIFAQPGQSYFFKLHVKLLNTVGDKMYHEVLAMIDITDSNGKHKYDLIGSNKYVTTDSWYAVGGDYHIPEDTESVRFYIQIREKEVNYLADDGEVQHIPFLENFDSEADKRIDQLRKADLQISVGGTNSVPVDVEVQQTKSEFGWGSAVNAAMIHDSAHVKYQNFFYNLFEWAVLENAIKWTQLEPNKGHFRPEKALAAVKALREKGVKVRGHNIFWGGEKHVPKWQTTMTPTELKQNLADHLNVTTRTFMGMFEHWDVNNENIHLHYYEDQLKDLNITQWMFREVHRIDPKTPLFLNDYQIVNRPYSTVPYLNQALRFKAAGVPLSGLGAQSHLGSAIDISVIQRRLDEVAKAGLPIWITELDVNESNEDRKALKYEELLKLYFSHPAVKGVMFWGFWDGRHWRPEAALANGADVKPNAAGIKVQELLTKTWRSNFSTTIQHSTSGHQSRVFKGSYQLLVRHNNKLIHTEHFDVGSQGNNIHISLRGTTSQASVDHVIVG